jgi:hypothetical protein
MSTAIRLTSMSIFRSACLVAMRVAGGSDGWARAFRLPLVLDALLVRPQHLTSFTVWSDEIPAR